ncbi:hypothetical protein INS49_004001 [Diaporthe citri]|uniref:uncharacterized protein n=1 Tax=Diaporthe citri TaxID=83186 RepID=UPI001C80DD86|nr:uncharacterized protein INS49_004001 [Diaporthe citri]KAG6354920.1 hypothetical protein INS49_004001 [Diaporthe citri]
MDTGTAPNTSEAEGPIDNSAPLAQIEASETINFKGGKDNATIRTLVSVKKCPHGFRSRLGYHANLYITLADGVEREIGYITAWRISRRSGVNPNIDPQYVLADWYFESLGTYDEDSKQLAYCIRSLYGKGEIPHRISERIVNREKRNEIQDGGNELVFIETIYIKWREDRKDARTEYRGYGLAAIYLETYYRLLGGKVLPAWFSLRGPVTYLLLPRMHHDWLSPVNQYWRYRWAQDKCARQLFEEEVETYLKGLFRSDYYGYEYYIQNAKIVDTYIDVLGRAVAPEDSISEPCDRLLLPAAD